MKKFLCLIPCFLMLLVFSMPVDAQIKAKDIGKKKRQSPTERTEPKPKTLRQETPSGNPMKGVSFRERVYFGGNVGLRLGTITNITFSPLVGYLITARLSAGPGITYRYFRNSISGQSASVLGYRAFARYQITPTIFAYSEFENLSVPGIGGDSRAWFNTIFAGVGYYQPLNESGSIGLQAIALYNFGNIQNSPLYASPFDFRIGFVGGGLLNFL